MRINPITLKLKQRVSINIHSFIADESITFHFNLSIDIDLWNVVPLLIYIDWLFWDYTTFRYIILYLMFSYQSPGPLLCRPKGFRFLRFRRLEKCHRSSKSSKVSPSGLPNQPLSIQKSRLSLQSWVEIDLRPGKKGGNITPGTMILLNTCRCFGSFVVDVKISPNLLCLTGFSSQFTNRMEALFSRNNRTTRITAFIWEKVED